MRTVFVATLSSLLLVACATTPTGRTVLSLVSDGQMDAMGNEAYAKLKQDEPVSSSRTDNRYARCIADAIIPNLPPEYAQQQWEVTVFDDDQANAFALPGGNIGIYEGLFKVATNQDQVAAVMGHEVAHVIAKHSAARVSTGVAAQFGMQAVGAFVSGTELGGAAQQGIMQALGLGVQVGVILPFSRGDESEADVLGLMYMADAGFDPRASVQLWENMASQGGGAPPEFMSTHPSHGTRIRQLEANMDEAVARYQQARRNGRRPSCRR